MKRAFVIAGIALALGAALPTIKNAVLYLGYHHGQETLAKREGSPGRLVRTWQGTFDRYQCGMDERHELRFTFDSDSTGTLRYRYLYQRLGGYGADVFSWRSLLPYDRSKASVWEGAVCVEAGSLIVLPTADFFTADTLVAAFEVQEGQMRLAYVNAPGEEPKAWGLPFSWRMARPSELLTF